MSNKSTASTAVLGICGIISSVLIVQIIKKYQQNNNVEDNDNKAHTSVNINKNPYRSRKIIILYGTTTGTAKVLSYKLYRKLVMNNFNITIMNISDYDEDKFNKEDIVLIVCSTWTDGEPPESCRSFFYFLQEYAYDFRISKDYLHRVNYAIFGLGGELYGSNYCKATREMEKHLSILGASPLLSDGLSVGDDASDLEEKFGRWSRLILNTFCIDQANRDDAMDNDGEEMSKRKMKRALRSKELSVVSLKNMTASKDHHHQQQQYRHHSAAVKKSNPKDNSSRSIYDANTSLNPNSHSTTSVVAVALDTNKQESSISTSSTSCCKSNKSDEKVINTDKNDSSCGCNSHQGGDHDDGAGDDDDEEEEEDRINNQYVTMDIDDASTEETTSHKSHHNHQSSSSTSSVSSVAITDMEDLGGNSNTLASKEHRNNLKHDLSVSKNTHVTSSNSNDGSGFQREMVTKLQRKALTKEGYKVIGTHSAVKICRWTKNQLRGRGGCYKHTFYGITSYQCMEATPSLACANKCVFCWRHHKNPVGTEWRWKEDPPGMIISEAIRLHQGMINEMKGVPGVQPERLQEAYTVKHCALSLVGEPIMYPHINELLHELHRRDISSFLVTNAQFPECIQALHPVTQLYVSIDASTSDSLKAIDRPLFKDFWRRFLDSLQELKKKQQRTVYRMTLVKAWNMNEADGYAELIESGQPDFIEIKAMTYCGKSDASSLTMQNVPWHQEVCEYGDALCKRLEQRGVLSYRYSIATEHEHSCCILIAREDKFKFNGQWYTWIDYPQFHQLIRKYHESNGKDTFKSEQYMQITPEWALYKSNEKGFDPLEQRWHRNKTTGVVVEIPYEASESGCG